MTSPKHPMNRALYLTGESWECRDYHASPQPPDLAKQNDPWRTT